MTNSEFNNFAPDVFNSRLAQANLIQRHILMLNSQVLMEKFRPINQNTHLFTMS